MIAELEELPECSGGKTQSLLLDFLQNERRKFERNGTEMSYVNLPEYIEERKLRRIPLIRDNSTPDSITVISASTYLVCRGEQNWNRRAFALEKRRQILDSFPEFNSTIFDHDSTVYDIIIHVGEELQKAVAVTFVCMSLACFFSSFVPASLAALSMLSITLCMLGSLSHWRQNLDPVTMVNVLIAIGFSVDFSAHLCVHFERASSMPAGIDSLTFSSPLASQLLRLHSPRCFVFFHSSLCPSISLSALQKQLPWLR